MKESIGIESRMKGLRIEEEVMEEEEEEEEEDRLSLSDLPIYDINSEEWEKYYDSKSISSSASSSSSISDQDLFEFVSEEWKNNALHSHHHPENILFCGKLIPYRNPMSENSNKDANEAKTRHEKRGSFLPRGKSSRWYIFLFGFPTHEMELKDLKNRQSRKVIASSSPSSALCPLKNSEENVRDKYGRGKGKKKGMWGLIKALSCSGGATYQAQSVVTASIGCISLV